MCMEITVGAFLPSLTGLSVKGLLRLTIRDYITASAACKALFFRVLTPSPVNLRQEADG